MKIALLIVFAKAVIFATISFSRDARGRPLHFFYAVNGFPCG